MSGRDKTVKELIGFIKQLLRTAIYIQVMNTHIIQFYSFLKIKILFAKFYNADFVVVALGKGIYFLCAEPL